MVAKKTAVGISVQQCNLRKYLRGLDYALSPMKSLDTNDIFAFLAGVEGFAADALGAGTTEAECDGCIARCR